MRPAAFLRLLIFGGIVLIGLFGAFQGLVYSQTAAAPRSCVAEVLGADAPVETNAILEALTAARQRYLNSGDKRSEGLALFCLGLVTMDQGQYPNAQQPFTDARRHFERALIAFRAASGEAANEARAQQYYARTYFAVRDFNNALPQFQSALTRARQSQNTAVQAEIQYDIGQFYYTRQGAGELALARDNFQAAADMFFTLQNFAAQADALYFLAETEYRLWNLPKAINDFRSASFAYNMNGDRLNEARAVHGMARILHHMGDLYEAEPTYEDARYLYQQAGDVMGEGRVVAALGNIYFQLNYDIAQETLNEAQRLNQQVGDNYGRAFTLSYLGDLALRNGDLRGARSSFENALQIGVSLNALDVQAYAYHGRGRVTAQEAAQGRATMVATLADFGEAIRIYRDLLGDTYNTRRVFISQGLAWFAVDRRNRTEWERWLFESANKAREVGDKRGEAESYLLLAGIYQGLIEYNRAYTTYQDAQRVAEQVNDPVLTGDIYFGLGEIEFLRANLRQARDLFGIASTNYYNGDAVVKQALADGRLGEAEQRLGNFEESIQRYEAVVAALQGYSNPRSNRAQVNSALTAANLNLGLAYLDLQVYHLAEPQLRAASAALGGDGFRLAIAQLGLGDVAYAQRRYSDAAGFYRSSQQTAQQANNGRAEALARSGIGSIQVINGDSELNIQRSFDGALDQARRITDRDAERRIFMRLAESERYLGRAQQAIDYFYSARNIALSLNDARNAAYPLLEVALIQLNDSRDRLGTAARNTLDSALREFRAINERGWEGLALQAMGTLSLRRAQFNTAVEQFAQAYSAFAAAGDYIRASGAVMRQGQVQQGQRRNDLALALYNQALRILDENVDTSNPRIYPPYVSRARGEVLHKRGDLYRVEGQYLAALTELEAADRLLNDPQLFAQSQRSQVQTALGNWALDQQQFIQALDYFESARSLAQTANDEYARALALYGVARTYAQDYDDTNTGEAQRTFSTVLDVFRSRAIDPVLARETLQSIADFYSRRKLYSDAETWYRTAWNEAREASDPVGEGYALIALGRLRVERRRFSEAVSDFNEAARQFQRGNDWVGRGAALIELAHLQAVQFNYLSALEQLQNALVLYETEADLLRQADVLTRIGEIYQQREQLALALDQHFSALARLNDAKGELAQEGTTLVGAGVEARIQRNIVITRLTMGQYDEAEAGIAIARDLATAAGDELEIATINELQGQVEYIRGQYQTAIDTYGRVAEVYGRYNMRAQQGQLYLNQADAYFQLALRQEDAFATQSSLSRIAYQRALDVARSLNNKPLEIRAQQGLGKVFNWLQQNDEAGERLVAALRLSDTISNPVLRAGVLVDLGLLAEERRELPLAINYYTQAIDLYENVYLEIRLETGQIAFASQNILPYHRLVSLYMAQGQPELAFAISERGRARSLLYQLGTERIDFGSTLGADLLNDYQERRGIVRSLNEAILDLRTQIENEASRTERARLEENIESLQRAIVAAQSQMSELNERIDVRSRVLSQVTEVKPRQLAEIQNELDDGTTIVSYYLVPRSAAGSGSVYAFIINRDNFQAVRLPTPFSELEQAVEGNLAAERAFAEIGASYTDVYQRLIAPLPADQLARHLVIVPHGFLHAVPFAALTGDGQAFLSDQYQLGTASSATFYALLKDERGGELGSIFESALVFGNPDSLRLGTEVGEDRSLLLPLLDAEEEAIRISRMLDVQPMLNEDATESTLFLQARRVNLIHIARAWSV